MTKKDRELVAKARAVCGEFVLTDDLTAGSMGAALRTVSGTVYTGICLDLACGLGFCAEVAAIAEMLKHRQTRIDTIVAVGCHGIMPPCGRCRETIAQVDPRNLGCRIILSEDRVVTLADLLRDHWLQEKRSRKRKARYG
jgi:cytidine deaminase